MIRIKIRLDSGDVLGHTYAIAGDQFPPCAKALSLEPSDSYTLAVRAEAKGTAVSPMTFDAQLTLMWLCAAEELVHICWAADVRPTCAWEIVMTPLAIAIRCCL